MRTLQSFLLVGVVCAATAALLPGCGSTDSGTSGGGAGATGAAGAPAGVAGAPAGVAGAPAALVGNAANGQVLYNSMSVSCVTCHGMMAEGGLGPNITGSTVAGNGGWTEAQFYQVVRNGVARSGAKICIEMTLFNSTMLSDQGIADIFAWTQSQKSDVPQKGMFIASDPKCSTE